jgi:hypothetical protein
LIGIRNKSATIISMLSILLIIAITLHLTQSTNPLLSDTQRNDNINNNTSSNFTL